MFGKNNSFVEAFSVTYTFSFSVTLPIFHNSYTSQALQHSVEVLIVNIITSSKTKTLQISSNLAISPLKQNRNLSMQHTNESQRFDSFSFPLAEYLQGAGFLLYLYITRTRHAEVDFISFYQFTHLHHLQRMRYYQIRDPKTVY